MTALSTSFSPTQVLVSFALAFISAYSAVSFADIYRQSLKIPSRVFSSDVILILMSVAIGGCAIWSMHFTGMAALTITDQNGEKIPLFYNTCVTILSLLVAIICVYLGLFISSYDRVYTKDKDELFKMLIEDTKNKSLKSVQKMHSLYLLAAFKGITHLAIGGVITGAGVCTMHYIGMTALNADLTIRWNPGLVFLSIIIAVVASTAAFWILFRLLPLFPTYESLRLGSSLIMAIAVCGMHYTGMMAATYHTASSNSGFHLGSAQISNGNAYLGALCSSVFLNWIFSMVIQSELRHYSQIGYKHSQELLKLYEKYPDERPISKVAVRSQGSHHVSHLSTHIESNPTGGLPSLGPAKVYVMKEDV
jgi:NO-binding membrane sensor protein with MHYT domain